MARKLKVNSKNVEKELLKGAKTQADLRRRTNNIAAKAGPGMEASVQVGRTRARGSVITGTYSARRRELEERALTRAIEAGRR